MAPEIDLLPTTTDVLVIGGGLAGVTVAYHLAREGVEVVLVERGELNREASGTNAGSFHLQLAIHQLSGLGTGADSARLLDDARRSVQALSVWRELDAELEGAAGIHITGGWMVAETPEQLQILHDKHELEARAGIETHVVSGSELRRSAPYLAEHLTGATYCPVEGHANPLAITPLLASHAQHHGAVVRRHTEVSAITQTDSRGTGRFEVRTSAGPISAHRIVNCAGAWSGTIASLVGLRFPLRREGLHMNVTEPRPLMLTSMVQHIGRRLTLKQTEHNTFLIGGGWPSPTSPAGRYRTTWHSAAGNLAVALSVVPALGDVRIIRTWSGALVYTDDFSPIVGESVRVPGFHACVSSTGFTFAPLFARLLTEQMTSGRQASPFPSRYALDRATSQDP